ncbi:MAG TPA: hypothetical protein VHV99_24470, partial [Paraburkholderia sp.]|nr:hypothetical protein [Paraburkholderia sp.]
TDAHSTPRGVAPVEAARDCIDGVADWWAPRVPRRATCTEVRVIVSAGRAVCRCSDSAGA